MPFVRAEHVLRVASKIVKDMLCRILIDDYGKGGGP